MDENLEGRCPRRLSCKSASISPLHKVMGIDFKDGFENLIEESYNSNM
jgi:hypothetical protein